MTSNAIRPAQENANASAPASRVTKQLMRWVSSALLGLSPATALADGDWIDEFPNVTVVAHAVSDQLKADTANWNFSVRGIALKDDDDLFSVYMTGTLVMLRQLALYKYEQDEKSLTKQDVDKLRSLVASYLEAELVMGKGVGSRRGYLTTAQKCRDMDCYRRWFKMHSMSVNGASYRERILPRMFCDDARATELQKLALSVGIKAPYLPSPAVTLQVESAMAGVAPPGCSAYGGDKDGNGLCDDWQPSPEAAQASDAGKASCLPIVRPDQPVFSGGVRAASNRWVEVRTGVGGRQGDKCETVEKKIRDCDGNVKTYNVPSGGGCGINNGISIRVKCGDGHVVQFISREYRLRGKSDDNPADGNLEDGQYGTGPYTADPDDAAILNQTCHWKTSSTGNRRWRTDSQIKSNPYYESGGSYTRSSSCMTMLDAPNVAFDPQRYLVIRIVGKSFAVCGCNVVSVIDWERAYYAGSPDKPVYEVKAPRDPNPGEIAQFQKESGNEGFAPWPAKGEQCTACK